MRAWVDHDVIVYVGLNGPVEIGPLPKAIGLERLRWDGDKIVDLADLDRIWVRNMCGAFELHAVQVAGAQLVTMTYRDRKHLMDDQGRIRVKSAEELDQEKQEETERMMKAKRDAAVNRALGEIQDQILWIAKLVFALIAHSLEKADVSVELNKVGDLVKAFPGMDYQDMSKSVERLSDALSQGGQGNNE